MRLICVLIAAAFLPISAHAQTQFLDSKSCGSSPGCTTAAMINTNAGSGMLAVCVASFADASTTTVTSSPSNTFAHTADVASGSGVHTALFYKIAPSVSGAQTVTVSNGTFTSAWAMSFSNTGALHGAATGAGNGTSTVQPGSQTPTIADLAISCGASYPGTVAISSPFFLRGQLEGANQVDGGGAFYQAPSITALNPTWTMTGTGGGSAAMMALFAGSTGAGATILTMSSPTLSSNGKSLTTTLTGCVTALSPSSGVTGVNVYYGGVEVYVAPGSITTSGCVMTVPLGSGQQTGDGISITLNTALLSNLTDSLGSTPASGQTMVSVTNGSGQGGVTANYNTADIYALGNWSASGSTLAANSYPSNSIEFACTNSTDAQILAPATGIMAQADGGAYTTITPTASGFSWQPIATGLTVGTHTFKVIAQAIFTTSSIRCSSSSTATLTPIATYSGATFTAPQVSPYTTSVTNFGAPTNTNATLNGIAWASLNGGFAFTSSTATKIGVYTFGTGGTIQLYQDGVLIGTGAVPSDSTYDAVSLVTGLSGTHTYRSAWQGPVGNNNVFTGLITDATLSGSPPATPININGCGDSIAVGFGLGSGSFSAIDWWLSTFPLGNFLGIGDQYSGAGGAQVFGNVVPIGALSTYCPTQILPVPVKAFIFTGGVNDCLAGVTQANFGGAYAAMMTNTAAASSLMAAGGKLFARGILATTNTGSSCNADVSTYNATISSRVSTYNGGSPTFPAIYIDTANWWNPANATLTADGLHPNAAGYAVIANIETPIMAGLIGSSYTLSCPATGTVGIAMTCTIALKGGATWTSLSIGVSPAETLNMSIAGITGTFGHGNPWNPTAGGNSDTITFTPTAAGAGTISSAATSAGWVDPSGAGITITAPPAGSMMMGVF